MEILKKIFQQAGWQLIGKGVTSFSTVIILGLITRNFGASETGVLTLALTYLSFFALVADFGINAHVLPDFLKGNVNVQWRKLLGFRIILAAVATFLAAILVFFWPGQSEQFKQTVWLGLLGVVEPGIFVTAVVVFQSRLRLDLSIIATAVGTLVILITSILLVRQGVGAPYLILGYVLGWAVSGILAVFFVGRYIQTLLPSFDFTYIKKVVAESWPISLTLVLNIVYFRVDTFIISFFHSFAEVGIYNVAFQIFQTLLVVPAFIMNAYYPVMLQNLQSNFAKFKSQLIKAAALMGALATAGTLLTVTLSPFAINLITGGKGFSGSVTSLQILGLSFPAFFLTSILMWVFIALRRYKIMLVIYIVGLLINGLFNLYFIPTYSYIAASWVTVAAEYLILFLQAIILIPLLKRKS